MTLRQLKKEVEELIKMLEDEYGKGADVNVVVQDENGELSNNVDIQVTKERFQYNDRVNTFMHPEHVSTTTEAPKGSHWVLAEITYG